MAILAPAWSIPNKPGLRSASENIADNTILLQVTPALPSSFGQVYYNIYFGETSIPEIPNLVSLSVPVIIPAGLAGGNWKFDVRAAVGGITNNISSLSNVEGDLYLYPQSSDLTAPATISSTTLNLSTVGFPADGYVQIDNEIILYTSLTPTSISGLTRGYNNTVISAHASGATVSMWRGAEAAGQPVTSISACGLSLPVWVDPIHTGLERTEDLGDGYSVNLYWDRATVPAGFSAVKYNIYESEFIKNLYAGGPSYTTGNQMATISGIKPVAGRYFGVRATYFLSSFTNNGMLQTSTGVFAWPNATTLSADLPRYTIGTVMVSSTAGYPTSGLLKINHEIVAYNSLTTNSFNLSRRDVFNLQWTEDYPSGTEIKLFQGIEDQGCYFSRINTSWDGSGLGALPLEPGDGYFGFLYLQDQDGYRNFHEAPQNEDHSIAEEDFAQSDPYDYCGLRSHDQAQMMSGDFCAPTPLLEGGGGTYHGNSANGQAGGINVFDGNLERQEMLLGITGSPFILLRRRWTGRKCRNTSHRNDHPAGNCPFCYRTGFEGGYDRYVHTRRIRPAEENTNGFVSLRVEPYNDTLELTADRGLSLSKTDLSGWLPALPTLRVRDVLIRYNFDYETKTFTEEFRYEVMSVSRNQIVLGKDGAQKVTLKRINITDEVYKYPVNLI